MRTLKIGIDGSDVIDVQGFLKDEGFYHGVLDGKFGPATDNAVKLFQKAHNLIPDGIIGAKSYKKFAELGFKKDGTELPARADRHNIRAIISANSHKLISPTDSNNPAPVAFDPQNHVIAVGIRGFNLEMGTAGVNNRRIYDDAHFIVTPKEIKFYEGNTDPNGFRRGSGTGSNKGMACLKTGVWFYGKGPHKGSPAFRQCTPFTVIRDGSPNYAHTGYHAINWHSGGVSSTSSLGCQTNRPNDFVNLRDYIYKAMETYNNPFMFNDWKQRVRAIPYILIEEVNRRRGILGV